LRHPAPVGSLALTNDGRRLLTTTNEEPVLRLWDVKTGRLLRTLRVTEEFTVWMTVIGITPDARRAFVVRHQRRNRAHERWWNEPGMIDLATGALVRWQAGWGGTGPPDLFALSPDGNTLAGIFGRDEIRVWEPATGAQRVLGTMTESDQFAGGICFSPDGTRVAVCRGGKEVFLAPVNGNGPVQSIGLSGNTGGVYAVCWPQPNRAVALRRYGLVAFDPTTGAELGHSRALETNLRSCPPQAAGGGLFFALAHYRAPLTAIDLTTLSAVPQAAAPHSQISSWYAVSADARVLAVASGHAVRVLDPRTGAPLHPDLERAPLNPMVGLQVSPDGAHLLGSEGDTAHVLGLADGRVLARATGRSSWAAQFALSPDGGFVSAVGSEDRTPLVVDVRTGRTIPLPKGEKEDDRNEVVGFAGTNRAWLWSEAVNTFTAVEIGTNRTGDVVPGYPQTGAVAVSQDGQKLAASGFKGLALWDRNTDRGWQVLDPYEDRGNAPRCGSYHGVPVRFSPCGRWLLVADPFDFGDDLEVWDLRNKPVRIGRFGPAIRGEHIGRDGGFSPDGRLFASAIWTPDGESELRVWELASASEVYRFRPARGVAGCAFTPDGRRLVIAHRDTTISVWDRAGVEARRLGAVPAGEEWTWLSARDARRAYAAVRALVAEPERALAVLGAALAPPDGAVTNRLLTELGSDDFPVRESAHRTLAGLGVRAEAALLSAVTRSESPEVRLRAAALLKALGPNEARLMGDRLRGVRAVAVLEAIASPQARALLITWAKTYPNSTLADEAHSALARLTKK
jgi:WD40 repeat protein